MAYNLANIVEKMVKMRLSEDRTEPLLEKYLQPSNIALLINPRCNQHIWMKLKDSTLKADLCISHVSDNVVKVVGSQHHFGDQPDQFEGQSSW